MLRNTPSPGPWVTATTVRSAWPAAPPERLDRSGQTYTRAVRLAMRALIYLAVPSVAFAWLLAVDFPPLPVEPLPLEAPFHWTDDTFEQLLIAAKHAALGAGVRPGLAGLW